MPAPRRSLSWIWLLLLAGCSFRPIEATPADTPGSETPDAPPPPDGGDPDGRTDWWHPDWRKRRAITIDTSKLAGAVEGFPILVRLTTSTIDYPAVADGGADLRFVAADQTTELAYDVDTFTRNATTLVWVRVPALAPAQTPTTIWLYYANPAAPPGAAPAQVFASHVSVHHLGANLQDATGNNHGGLTLVGSAPSSAGGVVGNAREFDGENDYVVLANSATGAYDFTTQLTVSAWVRAEELEAPFQAIVTKGDTTWRIHRNATDPFIGFGSTVAATNHNLPGTRTIDDEQWHHVAITYNGNDLTSERRIYVDGTVDVAVPFALAHDTNTRPVSIGRNEESMTGGPRYWEGRIDEVRISGVPRSAAWIHAEHLTVTDTSFVAVGTAEDL